MLKEITLDQLLSYKLSPGDIYWCRPSGKESRILDAASYVDKKFLTKYAKSSNLLKIDWKINKKHLDEGVRIFLKLKNSKFENERVKIGQEFAIFLQDIYWNGKNIHKNNHTFFALFHHKS